MQDIGRRARHASRAMARASNEQKNQALMHIARLIRERTNEIERVNGLDVARAKNNGQDAAFIDRLTMTPKTIESMVSLKHNYINSFHDPQFFNVFQIIITLT